MSNITDYKCPNCGGAIKFNAANGELQCESCDSIFSQEALETLFGDQSGQAPADGQYNWQTNDDNGCIENMSMYICKNCGAEIAADATTAATACPYCGSPVVLNQNVSGINKPDLIIPFKLDKNAAVQALVKHYKAHKLVPDAFNPEKHIDDIRGVYVPFWLFDAGVYADIHYEGTRTRHWEDSRFRYTETSYFDIYRAGNVAFSNIPTDASQKMEDEYMDGLEPFKMEDAQSFNALYLSGFLADKYDVDAGVDFPRAEKRIKSSAETAFRGTVKGFDTVRPRVSSITPHTSSYKYAMLPVWVMTAKWNGQIYKFAVNGQTGTVAGNLPYDKKKLNLYRLAWFAGSAAVLNVGYFALKFFGII